MFEAELRRKKKKHRLYTGSKATNKYTIANFAK